MGSGLDSGLELRLGSKAEVNVRAVELVSGAEVKVGSGLCLETDSEFKVDSVVKVGSELDVNSGAEIEEEEEPKSELDVESGFVVDSRAEVEDDGVELGFVVDSWTEVEIVLKVVDTGAELEIVDSTFEVEYELKVELGVEVEDMLVLVLTICELTRL